jgi:hypothetical protein
MCDYLDREALLALDETIVDRLLTASALTGHGGQPCIDATVLEQLMEMRERDSRN